MDNRAFWHTCTVWDIMIVSCESWYGEFICRPELKRVSGSSSEVKRHMCKLTEEKGYALGYKDVREEKDGTLSAELDGLETIEAHLIIRAFPEQAAEDVRRELFDIVWETDGEEAYLPERVLLPGEYDEEEAADYLSDKYGFLVKSFTIR